MKIAVAGTGYVGLSMQACIDYVLETYKILKEILINMQK